MQNLSKQTLFNNNYNSQANIISVVSSDLIHTMSNSSLNSSNLKLPTASQSSPTILLKDISSSNSPLLSNKNQILINSNHLTAIPITLNTNISNINESNANLQILEPLNNSSAASNLNSLKTNSLKFL